MSAFEFVLISFAIIVGLGVSEVLAGWADQIRARARLRPYPLQLLSSAFILYLSIQYLWLMWGGRVIEWTFPRFLAVTGPVLALALAARVCRMDTSPGASPFRDQYFRVSPAIYTLLAAFPLFITAMSLFSDLREMVPDPPNLLLVTVVRLSVLGLYIALALSRSERFHKVGIGLLWLTAIGFLVRMGQRLEASAP